MAVHTIQTFTDRIGSAAAQADSLVCIGLDPDFNRFPAHLRDLGPRDAIVQFNRAVIEATADIACAYKPNLGFYVSYGLAGLEALVQTRAMIPSSIPAIL